MQADESNAKTRQRLLKSCSTYKSNEKNRKANSSKKNKMDPMPLSKSLTQTELKHSTLGIEAFPLPIKLSDKYSVAKCDNPKVSAEFTNKQSRQRHSGRRSQSSAAKEDLGDLVAKADVKVETPILEPSCSSDKCVKPSPEAINEVVDLKPDGDCDALSTPSSLEEKEATKFHYSSISELKSHPKMSHAELSNVIEVAESKMETSSDIKLEVVVCNWSRTAVQSGGPYNHSIAESLNSKLNSLIRKHQQERIKNLLRFIELGLDDHREIFGLHPMDRRSCYLWKLCHTELCHTQNQAAVDCFSREIQTDKPQMAPYSSWTQIPPSFDEGNSGHVWFACRFNSTYFVQRLEVLNDFQSFC